MFLIQDNAESIHAGVHMWNILHGGVCKSEHRGMCEAVNDFVESSGAGVIPSLTKRI